jgi:hypothetical protein
MRERECLGISYGSSLLDTAVDKQKKTAAFVFIMSNKEVELYREHDDFVTVLNTRSGTEVRIAFEELTLEDFRSIVGQRLFSSTTSNSSPHSEIRLVWCGKELKPGALWHTGELPDDESTIKMKELNPGCRDGQPMIHAIPR